MQKEKELRENLKNMGVNSLGIYLHRETPIIAVHCELDANKDAIRDILEFYADSGEQIIL